MKRRGRPVGTTGSQTVRWMRFTQWASAQPQPPCWRQIQGFLGCSSNRAREVRRLWLSCLPNPYSRDPTGGNRIHADQESPP